MMYEKTVLWIDDEPSLMDAELFDLENHFFVPLPFQWVGDALTWLIENVNQASTLCGIVVDVQLPSRADGRFSSVDGVPVGVMFCEQLRAQPAVWAAVSSKLVLYTRLPSTSPAAEVAKTFAEKNGVVFRRKSSASRVALDLIRERVLTQN
jgi:hypothetical protein